jgi:hypothetical protein
MSYELVKRNNYTNTITVRKNVFQNPVSEESIILEK